ncbi:hypothetical protein AMECASPLE_012493, partial [Ameca splendens]
QVGAAREFLLCYNCKTHHWQKVKRKDNANMSVNPGKDFMSRKMVIRVAATCTDLRSVSNTFLLSTMSLQMHIHKKTASPVNLEKKTCLQKFNSQGPSGADEETVTGYSQRL